MSTRVYGNGLDHVEVLIGVGEGLISGLHDGLKTFYFGDTPFMQEDGELAIKDASVTVFPGEETPDPVTFRLGGSSESTAVSTTLFTNVPVVRTTASSIGDVDALEVRLIVDYCDKHGTDPWFCTWVLEYKQSSSPTWLPLGTDPDGRYFVNAFINSVKVFEWIQKVPRVADTYDIRVTKITDESDSTHHVSTQWESFQEITNGPLTLPNTAVVLVEAQATSQFSSLPSLWGVYDGLICHVPTNYDPVARTFDESSGPWDGTFKLAFTNDPVWILREIITNDRFGMNAFFPATIDKFDCYDASKYTSEKVDDGHGGQEPRFTFNQWVSEPMAGMDLINMIAATFFGKCFDDGNGTIILRVDKDEDPVALFTPEMVENGLFTYSYSDLNLRYNQVTTTFINPQLNWNQDRRVVTDLVDQGINGIVPCDLQMPDCTDPQEACRRALFRMISALTEKETVVFKTNRMGSTVEAWQVILIADPDMGYSLTGRVKTISVDRKTVTFRDALPLEFGVTYTMVFQTGAGLISKGFTVSSSGSYTSIVFTTALDAAVLPDMAFSIGNSLGTPGLPKPYRILNISVEDGSTDKQTITAIEVNRLKYDLADTGVHDLDVLHVDQRSDTNVAPPVGPLAIKSIRFTKLGKTHNLLTLNWSDAPEPHLSCYRVEYSLNGNSQQLLTETRDTQVPYLDPMAGDYTFYVYSINKAGNASSAISTDYTVDSSNIAPPIPNVSGLEIENQGNDNTFTSSDVKFAWRVSSTGQTLDFDDEDAIAGLESGSHDSSFKDFFVEFFDTTTGLVFFSDRTTNPFYTFNYSQNRKCPGGPRRTFKIGVTYRAKHGAKSQPSYLTVTNPAPAAVTGVTAELGPGTATFSWDVADEPDVDGYQVWRGTAPGFTPSDANRVYKGKANTYLYAAGPGTTAYIRVAAYDKYDVTLNYSNEYTLAIPSLVTSIPPGSITGSKLGIQTSGMLMDTEFADLAYWTVTAGGWALDSGSDVTGTLLAPIAFKTAVGNGTTTQAIGNLDTPLQTAEPNTVYRLRLDTLLKAGFTGQISVKMRMFDRTQTLIGTSPIAASSADGRTVAIATDTLATLDGQVTTPSNVHYVSYRIQTNWSTTQNNAQFAYVARPQLHRATSSSVIVPLAIQGSHVANSTLTGSKIATGQITDSHMVAGTLTNASIANSTITGAKIAATTIATGNIALLAIDTTLLAANAVTGAKIATGQITDSHMVAGTLTAASIANATITGAKIAATTIATGNIALLAIDTTLLAANAVTGAKIAAATITGAKIAANTLTDSNLVANTITNASIALLTINTGLLAANAVTGAKIAAGQITDSHMVAGTLTAASIANATITGAKIAATTIATGNIALLAIDTTLLAANAVTGAKIATGQITDSHMVAGTLTATSIANATITGAKIAATTIATGNIALLAIDTTLLAANAVTGAKIATGQITDSHMVAGTLTATSIAAATITGAKIAANTLTDSNLVANTITNASIALLTINTGLLAANAVTGAKIAAGEITDSHMVAGTLTATSIANATITGAKIAATTIATGNIALLAIDTTLLAANAVTGAKIATGQITDSHMVAGTLTATSIANATITGAKIAATTIATGNIALLAIDTTLLAANAVTGAKIATGQITDSHMVAGTLTNASIANSTIISSKLAAGAVIASKLAIQTSNMLLDTDFSDTAYWTIQATWTVTSGTDITTTLKAPVGLQSPTGNGTTTQATTQCTTPLQTVEPGVGYRGRMDVLVKSGFTGMFQYQINWLDRTQTLLSTSTFTSVDYRTVAASGDVLSVFDGQATVPANTHYAQVRLRVVWSTTLSNAGSVFMARPMLQPVIFNSHIAAGTLAGTKLTAASVTTTQIAANTIVAGNIANSTITGGKIAANTITDSNITALTISSASIANSAITSFKIAAGNVLDSHMSAGTLTGASIAAGAIGSTHLAASSVTSGKIAPGVITDTQVSAKSITSASISYAGLDASTANYQMLRIADVEFLSAGNSSSTYWNLSAGVNAFTVSNGTDVTTGMKLKAAAMSVTGNGTTSQGAAQLAQNYFTYVEATKSYRFRALVYIKSGFTGSVTLYASWVTQGGTKISQPVMAAFDYRTVAATADILTNVEVVLPAHALAYSACIDTALVWSSTLNNAGKFYVGGHVIERAFDPSMLAGKFTQVTATNGGSYSLTSVTGQDTLFDHSSTIATFTINMPVAPNDGMDYSFATRSTITACTFAAGAGSGQTFNLTVTTLTAAAPARFRYCAALNMWIYVT